MPINTSVPTTFVTARSLDSRINASVPTTFVTARNMDKELGDFEYHTDTMRTVGLWRYEDPGDGRLIPADKTVVRCNFASRTGVAFIKKGTENGIDIPELATAYEAWVQFDVYAYGHYNDNKWSSIACYFKSNGNKSSGIQIFNAESSTSDTIRIWSNDTKQKYFTDTFCGLHTVKMHIKSSTTNGLIELYIDNDVSPYASYSGNVNQGEALHTFYIRCACDDTTKNKILISNFIVTNIMPPSINDVVPYEKERYKYINLGMADKLTVTGTTVQTTDKSITGTAFYQTAQPTGGCFGVPMMDEVWMKFDLYHTSGTKRFRCYANSDSITGVCLEQNSSNRVRIFTEGNDSYAYAAKIVSDIIQTYIVHMKSGAKDGLVEVWIDGEKVLTYTASKAVSPLGGLYFQSDDGSNLFSNVVVSDNQEALMSAINIIESHHDMVCEVRKAEQNYFDIIKEISRGHESADVYVDMVREIYKTEYSHTDIQYESSAIEECCYDIQYAMMPNRNENLRFENPGIEYNHKYANHILNIRSQTHCGMCTGVTYPSTADAIWEQKIPNFVLDVWVKFDAYLYSDDSTTSTLFCGAKIGNSVTACISILRDPFRREYFIGIPTDYDSMYTQYKGLSKSIYGLHSYKVHFVSGQESGVVELYIDNENTPFARYRGNVNNGFVWDSVYISCRAGFVVSNMVISENTKPSFSEFVNFSLSMLEPYHEKLAQAYFMMQSLPTILHTTDGRIEDLDGQIEMTDSSGNDVTYRPTGETIQTNTKSKVGVAFYQTEIVPCFPLPETDEVWIQFDLYHENDTVFYCFVSPINQRSMVYGMSSYDGNIGIRLKQGTTDQLEIVGGNVVDATVTIIPNKIQTYRLHIQGNAGHPVIELWIDGQQMFSDYHSYNCGFIHDVCLATDNSDNLFSNVVISNNKVALDCLTDGAPHYDIKRQSYCTFEYHNDIMCAVGSSLILIDEYYDIDVSIANTVKNNFDILRDTVTSVKNHFDTYTFLPGSLYYEDPGDGSNQIISGVQNSRVYNKTISRTGVSLCLPQCLNNDISVRDWEYNVYDGTDTWAFVNCWTKDVWIKFDIYGENGGHFRLSYYSGWARVNEYTNKYYHGDGAHDLSFNFSDSEIPNGFVMNESPNSAFESYENPNNTDKRAMALIGLHAIKIHLVSHVTDGVIEVYVDDDETPFFTYHGQVNYGRYIGGWAHAALYFGAENDVPVYLSNIVISSNEPSLNYVVPYDETEHPVTTHADTMVSVKNPDYKWCYKNPGNADGFYTDGANLMEIHNSPYSKTGVGLAYEYNWMDEEHGYTYSITRAFPIIAESDCKELWIKFDMYGFYGDTSSAQTYYDSTTNETYTLYGSDDEDDDYPATSYVSVYFEGGNGSVASAEIHCSDKELRDGSNPNECFFVQQGDNPIYDNMYVPLYGFHTVKVHIKSDDEDGVFEVYVDTADAPLYEHHGKIATDDIIESIRFNFLGVVLSNIAVSNYDIDIDEPNKDDEPTLSVEGIATHKTVDLGSEMTVGIGIVIDGEGYAMIRTAKEDSRYTEWENYVPCERLCRYIDVRLHVRNEITSASLTVDKRTTSKTISKHLTAGDNIVEYGESFYNIPAVIPTAIGDGVTARVISKGKESCVIKITDNNNNAVDGDVDILIRGW